MIKHRIAIIDDEPSIRELLTEVLKRKYQVDTYKRYEDLVVPNAELYFMDNDIKDGMTGIEWIMSHYGFVHEDKRILMSGDIKDNKNVWERSKVSGYYLPKPFDIGEVERIVDYIMRD